MYLWAGVRFTALGGQTADFLQRATAQGFKLRRICAVFGGFSAQCSAGRYRALYKLAKSCHVRLHVVARQGAYFSMRGIFVRRGIWCGLICFFLFLQFNQNLIWQVDYTDLTIGQQARVEKILWETCSIAPGAYSSEVLLAAGEIAILTNSQEFSWVSLNFAGGRLTVEATVAMEVPEISIGADADILARADGQIVSVNVQQGTAMVTVGQEVMQGDVLIAAARLEHDQESLVYEVTAGEVFAQLSTSYCANIAMVQESVVPSETIGIETSYRLFAFGKMFMLADIPQWFSARFGTQPQTITDTQVISERMVQLNWLGFSFPVTIWEENIVAYTACDIIYTQEECLALARLSCSEALYAAYPDAIVLDVKEEFILQEMELIYQVSYEIIADICSLS